MEVNRRALYNSLRMNWVLEPTTEVEVWQVEDYRSMPMDSLFERLEDLNIRLDKTSFLALAEEMSTPEELAETLLAEFSVDKQLYDQVYLLGFELWRRLLPEKPSFSILCDELDHQIYLYDRGETKNVEAMEDILANLQVILDENTDEGADPHEAFDCVSTGCANDIEGFLYDFISEQVDNGNNLYANELIDGFSDYIKDSRWFEFLRARLLSSTDPMEANQIITRLVNSRSEPDLEFNLELLSFLVSFGDKETFERLVKQSAKILQTEEDFQSLLSICADFYHRLDEENVEKSFQDILDRRIKNDLHQSFDPKDPHLTEFFNVLSQG